ncbi:FkbM family methyltransferase [Candidatus Pacearchaeota archaeon]|nr:FkbM family methyltransferase [Candidatus Pacearchaeota archaeon]
MTAKSDFNFIEKRIKDKKSFKRLQEIKEDWQKVEKEGKIIKGKKIFDINIGQFKFWLRKNAVASSIEIYLEIFKHKTHMVLPEFKGKKDKVIFDVGANEGFYTFGMKENNPKLKIVAIEPVPSTFKLLKKNIQSNKLKDVILVNQALTKKKGKITFEMVPEVTFAGALDIAMQRRKWLDAKRIKKIIVNSTTLIDLCKKLKIDKIDILKIDVEGSELDILKSSKNFLLNIKKIVIEWHSKKLKDECKGFLKKNGFKLVREEKQVCGDLYFINKSQNLSVS